MTKGIEQTRMDAFTETAELLRLHMERFSVPIITVRAGAPAGNGSGTCVRIGDKHLIATAAHVIEGFKAPEISLVRGRQGGGFWEPIHALGSEGGADSDPVDIAWLEVKPECLDELSKEFLPVERLRPFHVHAAHDALVEFSGYPGNLIPPAMVAQQRLPFRLLAYLTATLPVTEWPTSVKTDVQCDQFLDYQLLRGVTKDGFAAVAEPPGMSGGGVWTLGINNSGLWTADMATLVGIEHRWNKTREYVRATQIQHWLNLVARGQPALASLCNEVLARHQGAASVP